MQLFREAGKAVCAMPALLFQPIYVSTYISIQLLSMITSVSHIVVSCQQIEFSQMWFILIYFQTYLFIGFTMVAWIYCMLWIESAGDIYLNRKNHVHFKKDALIIVRERIIRFVGS